MSEGPWTLIAEGFTLSPITSLPSESAVFDIFDVMDGYDLGSRKRNDRTYGCPGCGLWQVDFQYEWTYRDAEDNFNDQEAAYLLAFEHREACSALDMLCGFAGLLHGRERITGDE